ncbi:unnamed protein product [marine sediment metagenome]|uniref:AB hydrolase-1 domain-containing protein n=1 Tax=marine sediment metagenome TaxID=412755 RepID=X1BXL3_9ZZZZ
MAEAKERPSIFANIDSELPEEQLSKLFLEAIMEWIEDIEERYIETNGITLHTVIIGEGEPLVLLHGFPDFWYGWKNLVPLIKDKFQLIIPDMRGYNLSDKPEGVENYRIELLIEDIIGLVKELNLKSIFLTGHDWGGVLSWFIAEKYPDKIRKLGIIKI